MIVFGMDVGFTKTGFAVFELKGTIETLIFATTLASNIAKEKKSDDYVAVQDTMACFNALTKWDEIFKEFKPKAAFLEIPSAGAKSARANRCMGMGTALAAAFLHRTQVRFELFLPTQVESALDVKLTPGEAKSRGMSLGQKTAWKKERLKNRALTAFPQFAGWPASKEKAEDSYDAVCAFLCGRQISDLYNQLKREVGGAVKNFDNDIV